MSKNLIETLMGAVVLATAGIFIFFAYNQSHPVAEGPHFIAKFDRADGLHAGSDVCLSGVKIGTVKKQMIDPKTYLAIITFTVNPEINLPKDTSAEITSSGFLGGKYLALVPGGAETYLKPGDEIQYTQSAINIEALIGQAIFSGKKDREK